MKEISLTVQIALLKNEVETRRRVYPVKVKMGQMTQRQADGLLATLQAVIKTLSTPPKPVDDTGRYLKIEPTLHHIYRCANEHRAGNEHCLAIAQLMEDSLGFVRDKKA